MPMCRTTLHYTTAEVKSDLGGSWSSMIREKIEAYGVGKFEGNAETVCCPVDLYQKLFSSSRSHSHLQISSKDSVRISLSIIP